MSGGTPDVPLDAPCTNLYPYVLTRGGSYYDFQGHTDVKELALYLEDQIKTGNWLFNVGIRGDLTTDSPTPASRNRGWAVRTT